jgi:plastocyanin
MAMGRIGLLTGRGLFLALSLSLMLALSGHTLADTVEVTILKMQFQPQEITVKKGDTVRWVNREKRQYHSVWFEQAGDPEPDYFFPEESYERKFPDMGSFPYRCGPHPEMTGTVHVVE